MSTITELGIAAKKAAFALNCLSEQQKNQGICAVADALKKNKQKILSANEKDVEEAVKKGIKPSLIDRLSLTNDRIDAMSEGLLQIADLKDPVGETLSTLKRKNGLTIEQKRVPLGVIGIIYESRPNVTADAFGLCFKTGNAVILRGGSDAIHSNKAITEVIQLALEGENLPKDSVLLLEDTSRESVTLLMQQKQYIDVLIPRGGAGLIQSVLQNSTIPVIETGTGNCHIYVDQYADLNMAVRIIDNAKTQRMGVCNACESLVIHSKIADTVIPMIADSLTKKNICIRGDETSRSIDSRIEPATEEDYGCEYLDAIISLKVVSSVEEAIAHINQYNTGHSESIITEDKACAKQFLEQIDAAAVYQNASTRFTDGNEFGFGAEIGISTQKLHVRGPMGLEALTTTKYMIYGDGQIRE